MTKAPKACWSILSRGGDWRQLEFPGVLPHHRMLPRIAPLGATKCPAFWPFGSTRPSLRDHNFAKVGELELDKRQARSNAGFPGNHHARLEFGLITCLDSSWPRRSFSFQSA